MIDKKCRFFVVAVNWFKKVSKKKVSEHFVTFFFHNFLVERIEWKRKWEKEREREKVSMNENDLYMYLYGNNN